MRGATDDKRTPSCYPWPEPKWLRRWRDRIAMWRAKMKSWRARGGWDRRMLRDLGLFELFHTFHHASKSNHVLYQEHVRCAKYDQVLCFSLSPGTSSTSYIPLLIRRRPLRRAEAHLLKACI